MPERSTRAPTDATGRESSSPAVEFSARFLSGADSDWEALDDMVGDTVAADRARRRWRALAERVLSAYRPTARTTEQKLPDYAKRGTALFVRTSSMEQADRDTRGSPSAQLAAGREDAARIGVYGDDLREIDAFGEAGTRKTDRKRFHYLRSLVRTRALGVVIVPEHHRLGRNVSDAEAFFTECADARVLLIINGQAFDPRVPTDRYVLGMMAQFAQYENESRSTWLLRGKLQRAKDLRARFVLPAGLVWAMPSDQAYVQAALKAGLGHYLAHAQGHRAKSPHKRGTYHILPFPQADVEAAARLRVQWLLEPGSSPARVLSRIQAAGSGWPRGRVGRVPKRTDSSTYHAGMRYGDDDWEVATLPRLADYLASPSLYGIYSFYMESLTDDAADRPPRARGSHGSFPPAARSRQFAPLPDAADLLALPATLRAPLPAALDDAPPRLEVS